MEITLLSAVRMPRIDQHSCGDRDPRKRRDHANACVAGLRREMPQDLWEPVEQAICACHEPEPPRACNPQRSTTQGLAARAWRWLRSLLAGDFVLEPAMFARFEPRR